MGGLKAQAERAEKGGGKSKKAEQLDCHVNSCADR